MMRCLEHIPVIGHAIAAVHACRGDRNNAERAAINATVGIVLAPVNIVAEVVDEATRDHSERLKQVLFYHLYLVLLHHSVCSVIVASICAPIMCNH